MRAVRNESSGTWHLIGTRGCGTRPDGETIEAQWSKIRDRVERGEGTQCKNCNWP